MSPQLTEHLIIALHKAQNCSTKMYGDENLFSAVREHLSLLKDGRVN